MTSRDPIPYNAIEQMVKYLYEEEQAHFRTYPAPNHVFPAVNEVQKWLERERINAA